MNVLWFQVQGSNSRSKNGVIIDPNKPLALWYIIKASKLSQAVTCLRDLVRLRVASACCVCVLPLMCGVFGVVFLVVQGFDNDHVLSEQYTEDQLDALLARMHAKEPGSMIRLEQADGMAVFVEPGAWHWVLNRQTNIKIVMDGYIDKNFPAYFESWYRVRSPYASDRLLSKDYSNIFLAAWTCWRDIAIHMLPTAVCTLVYPAIPCR